VCSTYTQSSHSTRSSGGWYKAGTEDTHFVHFTLYITVLLPSHCRLYSRVREIPTRMMIPQKTEWSPGAYTQKNRNENKEDRRNS